MQVASPRMTTLRRLVTRPKEPAPAPLDAPRRPPDLDTIAAGWQRALDASQRALEAAERMVPSSEVVRRKRELVEERRATATSLAGLARELGIVPAPWLSAIPVTNAMLGLPTGVRACVFDLDGVLTDSGVVHAAAWAEVFDALLLRLAEKTGWQVIPFDRDADYRAFIDGRRRLEGIHAFLRSRGIHLPEGRVDDPAGVDTAYGLARHKREALARGLDRRGVAALAGARRYLEACGRAGLGRAVVSGSASTLPMLERAGLAALVDVRVDAEVMGSERLRSRPAPDVVLAACRRLGVRPEEAVTFTHTPEGIAAGCAAGVAVVAVGAEEQFETFGDWGAERAVPALANLLDRRLA